MARFLYRFSLRTRIALFTVLLALSAATLELMVTILVDVESIKSSVLKNADAKIKALNPSFSNIIVLGSLQATADAVSRLEAYPEIHHVFLTDLDGKPLFYYQGEDNKEDPLDPETLDLTTERTLFSDAEFEIVTPLRYGGRKIGWLYLVISVNELESLIKERLIVTFDFVILIAVAAALVAALFQRLISTPLNSLASTLRQITETRDYSIRVQSDDRSEIGELYRGLNCMLEAIQNAHNELANQKFALDASALVSVHDKSGTVIYVNPKYIERTGYSAAEMLGADLQALLSGNQTEELSREIIDAVQWRRTWRGELCQITKSGELFWSNATIVPLPASDNASQAFVAVWADISEQKKLLAERELLTERLTQAKEQAEAGSKAKTRFLASMSHEIRTPLNAIQGAFSLLGETGQAAENRRLIELGQDASEMLNSLISDILNLSRIEAGKLQFDPIRISLEEILDSVVEMLWPRARSKNLSLNLCLHPSVPRLIETDPGRMRQVLLNLIGNAVKYTFQGGIVIELSLTDTGQLRFDIHDTGVGIPEADLDNVFSDFFQLRADDSLDNEGSGLGLAIAKRLVTLMGGEIGVISKVGKGSTFWFSIPGVSPGEREPAAFLPRPPERFSAAIISTDALLRDCLVRQLEMFGIHALGLATIDERCLQKSTDVRQHWVIIDANLLDTPDSRKITARLCGSAESEVRWACIGETDAETRQFVRNSDWQELEQPLLPQALLALFAAPVPVKSKLSANPETPAAASAQNGVRILLAEDNPANQMIISMMLRKSGHTVDVVSDGEKAVESLRLQSYDLVLMDINMPRMNGIEAARCIRSLPLPEPADNHPKHPPNRIPIIAITANMMQDEYELCLQAGMDGFLSKPVVKADLLQTVDNWSRRADAGASTQQIRQSHADA